jgi:Calcineurin-like phosphoesterase
MAMVPIQEETNLSDLHLESPITASSSQPGARLTRGPYLQMVTEQSVVLRWRTDWAVTTQVRFGTNLMNLERTLTDGTLTTEHEINLDNLAPGTRYYYSAGTTSGVLGEGADYFFTTAPAPESALPIRVWVVGDSGHSNTGARQVRDAYQAFTGTRGTDLMLMLGDNAYESGTDAEMQTAIYSQYAAVLRNTPVWPALGNHDAANSPSVSATLPHFTNWTLPTKGEAGGEPSGTEKYYSFNYGNIHFVCLDSYASDRALTGPMMNWLRTDLASNTREWVIAYWHHPPYSKGTSDSDSTPESVAMRGAAVRVLEDAGVDLVLGGHSHGYERSYLIDGHYGASATFVSSMKKNGGNGRDDGDGPYYKLAGSAPHQGTVYVVAGSSSSAEGGALNHPAMFLSLNVIGSMVLDVNGGRLKAVFLDAGGVVRDWFAIQKTFPPVVIITVQPQSQAVEPGQPVTLRVGAISANPIAYQWHREGVPLPGATNEFLLFPGVREEDQGLYDVVVADGAGVVTSVPARVSLRILPQVVQPPVDVTVVQGGNVTLSVQSIGTLPMGYRWRRGSGTLTNRVLDSHQDFGAQLN